MGTAGTHACRTLLAREHKRIRAEYEERVKQLEQERQGVEEERVQVISACLILDMQIMTCVSGCCAATQQFGVGKQAEQQNCLLNTVALQQHFWRALQLMAAVSHGVPLFSMTQQGASGMTGRSTEGCVCRWTITSMCCHCSQT